jgi:nucleoside-diphosphate-sugar epimerase
MLVPAIAGTVARVIDVRDLAEWMLDASERGITGAFNAMGEPGTVGEFIAASRSVGGHRGEVVSAPAEWLSGQGVAEWSGPESLPLWVADPEWGSFMDRSIEAARAAGLRPRPIAEMLRDTLEWERAQGLGRERRAGLTPERERALIARWRQEEQLTASS